MGFDNKPTDKTKQKAQESTNDVLKRMSKDYSSVQTTGGGSSSYVVGNPDIINKGGYDAMHKSPEDLEITMAKNQTALELVDRTVSGFTYNAASSFISNFGSFDPNLTYNMMVGQESEYSNIFLDYAGKLQQKGQAQTQKIYKKDPTKIIDFTDPAYWAEQTIQAGTSFGMFAASTLETLALSAILPGGGTAMAIGKNTAKGIVQMQKAKKYKQFLSQTLNYLKKAPTQALTFGVVNRHAESVMEASETFKSLQQEFLDKGYDEEVAKKYAADGAARVYKLNMPLFLIDAAQWTLLTRLSPFKGSSTFIDNMLDKIKNPVLRGATALGMNMISEGAEEGYQHIAQEEGQFFAKSKLSDYNEEIESKGSFTNRMGNYLTDAHFWNAVVAGAYGSLLLAPIGGAGGHINQKRLEKSQKEFNEKL
jgi:thermostable 8-oxoguanine DNA glycosylase